MAGLHPKSPGFKTVSIEPHLGPLLHVRAVLFTPSGKIEVKYQRHQDAIRAELILPPTVSGDLVWRGRTRTLYSGAQTAILELEPGERN